MTETAKYHVSRNGYLTRCSASKRSCPRGGDHFTQPEYDKLVQMHDPRVRTATTGKHDPDSYYGKAEKAYEDSVRRLQRFDAIIAEQRKFEQRLMKERGLSDLNGSARMQESDKAMKAAYDYAKEVYMEEGVNPAKASFIIQDMKNNVSDPLKPILKKRDRLDPDIAAKTKNAVERLNTDSKYKELTAGYTEAKRREALTHDVIRKAENWKNEQLRTSGVTGMPNFTEEKEFQRAKAWLKAGIPPEAKDEWTASITPDRVSTDSKGRINNVWVETENGIERVVGYNQRSKEGYSGALVTENGTEVNTWTHYHSYKGHHGGIDKVIIGAKNGAEFPEAEFNLSSSWDSGD